MREHQAGKAYLPFPDPRTFRIRLEQLADDKIRERLKLIYGDAGELRIAENTPSGTRVSIVVPYKAT